MERQAEAKVSLLVVRGSRSGERVWILHGEHPVGSDVGSDIRLMDDGVRARHAVVVRTSGSVTIGDAGFTNATWVNGTRLTSPHKLCSGDEVGIGSATLRFEEASSSSLAEPAPSAQPGLRVRRRVRTGHIILVDGVSLLAVLAALTLALILVNSAGWDDTTGDAVLPVGKGSYAITAEFGQSGSQWQATHTGLDFAAPEGTQIHAVTAGIVIYAGPSGGPYGNLTKIRSSDGTESWYAHQSRISLEAGETVTTGQVIGAVGATGNVTGAHLHLEIRIDGSPTDPRSWLSARGVNP